MPWNRSPTFLLLTAALTAGPAIAKAFLHTGSSIESRQLGYAGTLFSTLKFDRDDFGGFETLDMIVRAFDQTKNATADLGFSGTDKMPKDGSKVYAGYDLVNFAIDYHTCSAWPQSAATDANREAAFKKKVAGVFDRFHREYPKALCTFTNSPPVKDPVWGDPGSCCFAYNTVIQAINKWAEEVAREKHVAYIDLFGYCREKGIKPGGDGRHFSSANRDLQGKFVGQKILAAMNGHSSTIQAPVRGFRGGTVTGLRFGVRPAEEHHLVNGMRIPALKPGTAGQNRNLSRMPYAILPASSSESAPERK